MRIRTIKSKKQRAHKKLRVCAYVRESADSEELENSMENQVEFFKNYIRDHPDWELVEIYRDFGISGFSNDRDDFLRMMDDARQNRFDLIVVKSISRFARNTETLLSATRELKQLGIGVFFYLQGINTLEAAGEFALTVRGALAQAESETYSELVKMGYRHRFERGLPTGKTKQTYGYRPGPDDTLVIDEDRAKVVRLMYDMAERGVWPSSIADYLNEHGIATATGAKWSGPRIGKMLRKETYKGDLVLQRTCKDSKRVSRLNDGKIDQWYITGSHPAIVTPEQWARVQEVLAERSRRLKTPRPMPPITKRSSHSTYPLSGLLHCPYCGELLIHKTGKKGREYWACRTNLKRSAAACRGIFVPIRVTEGWDITEPAVVEKYKDADRMVRYTAYPIDEYEFKEEHYGKHNKNDNAYTGTAEVQHKVG